MPLNTGAATVPCGVIAEMVPLAVPLATVLAATAVTTSTAVSVVVAVACVEINRCVNWAYPTILNY